MPATVHVELSLVDPLERGKKTARETAKVRPVNPATVAATLPNVSPTVRAMVELQLATGMRLGELCILRPRDVDRDSNVWEYEPFEHKNAHREQERLICIGPRGQDILRPFLLRPADSYCFSPAESMEWYRAARHSMQ